MNRNLGRSLLEEAQKYAEIVISACSDIDDVLLFGSVITNKCHSWSDIDVAIISNQERESSLDVTSYLYEIAHINGFYRIHPIHITTHEFNNNADSFVEEVRKGVSIMTRQQVKKVQL